MLPENDDWLLILDSVDDIESFQIENYFPKKSNSGKILITSRRSDFSRIAEAVEIDGLELEEAITLLLKLICVNTRDEQGMVNQFLLLSKFTLI